MSYDSVKCPECGGPMISRTGPHGVFWGCKQYPQCRGTRDSMGRSKAERTPARTSRAERGAGGNGEGGDIGDYEQ